MGQWQAAAGGRGGSRAGQQQSELTWASGLSKCSNSSTDKETMQLFPLGACAADRLAHDQPMHPAARTARS